MRKLLLSTTVGLALSFSGGRAVLAAEYFIAPSGTASGDGSKAKPFSLASVLTTPLGQPGDTFWVMGGNYALGYVSSKLQGAPGKPVAIRAVPGQRATVDGAITLFSSAGYVDFWGLEWMRSDTHRTSTQTGFNPTDINKHNGFNTYVPHVRLINMAIHDQIGAGAYISHESVGSEIHGCLSYNNGYTTTDIQDGHGFYFKNDGETLLLSDNFAFNGIASGFHAFTEDVDNFNNITLDGNVAFNAGVYSPVRGYRDLLVGGDGGQVVVDNIIIKNSFLYYKPGSPASVLGMAQIGRDGVNGKLTLANNHFTAGVQLKNWQSGSVTGNRVGASGTLVDAFQNLASGSAMTWSGNAYQSLNSAATPYKVTKASCTSLSFANWKQQTGFDASSALVSGGYSGVEVYVRPNKYEPGRANIIVYNWAKQSTVSVDVSGVLPIGTSYQVRNVQDFFAAPVLAGVYQGGSLVLPMNGLTVSKPNGPFTAAAAIGPEFNAFVLVALPSGTPDAVAAVSGVATTIAATTLLANDTKVRAPLTLTAVSSVSSKNGSVSLASGQVTYKSAAGFSGTDTFTYTVLDGLGSVGTGLVTVTVGGSATVGTQSFANSAAVTIPAQGRASAYPMPMTVSGMGGLVSKVTVKFVGLSHTCISDVAAMLVSPDGRAVELFSLIGGHGITDGVTLVFDDAAAGCLPSTGNLASGTYKPSVVDGVAILPTPAPASGIKTTLSSFAGAPPNGVWSLYVADLYANDGGTIAGGWVLNVTTTSTGGAASSAAELVSFRSAPAAAQTGTGIEGLGNSAWLSAKPDRSVDLRLAPGTSLEMSTNGFDWLPVATGVASIWTDGTAARAMSRLYRVSAPGHSPVISGFARYSVPAFGFAVVAAPFGPLDCAQAFAGAPEGTQVYVFDPASSAFSVYTWRHQNWTAAAGGAPVVPSGTACFVRNPAPQSFEVVVSGVVPVSAPTVTYAAGYQLVAPVSPEAGLVESRLGLSVGAGDRIHRFIDGTYVTYRRTAQRWLPAEPALSLGEGFFLETRRGAGWPSPSAE